MHCTNMLDISQIGMATVAPCHKETPADWCRRHPKVVENEKALEVVLHLDEKYTNKSLGQGRRLTVTAVGVPQHLTEVEESDR